MPPTGACIEYHRTSGLDTHEGTECEAVQQDITCRIEAPIVPHHGDRPRSIADCRAWEIVHREAIIARDKGGIQRDDADCVGGCRFGTGGWLQGQCCQAFEGYVVHNVHGRCIATGRGAEYVGGPIMLIRNVDIAGCHVHRRVRAFVLTELRIIGSHSKVWESPCTLGERLGTAIITDGRHGCATERTYSTTGRADIANCEIDLSRAIEPEVGIGHVEATSHRV